MPFFKTNLGTCIAFETQVYIPALYVVPEKWYCLCIDISLFQCDSHLLFIADEIHQKEA